MFTSDAVTVINRTFTWIYNFINIRPPGMTVTLWQLALGLFLFRFLWHIVLSLLNTHFGGLTYRGSSYHGEDKDSYERYEQNRERMEAYKAIYKERHK